MSREIKFNFEGEPAGAVAAFDKVGSSARSMASKVDDTTAANTRLGERVGSNESKFMGTADLLDGLGGAFGLPTEGATQLARGLGDLSGGFEVVSGMIPGLSGMFPKLAGAMSFISAHPLIIGLLAGGAIIAGLILLEKKFGVVSGAVEAMGGAFRSAWEHGVKPALNFMIGGIELYLRAMAMPFTLLNKIPGVGNLVPDGLANVRLPRLATGGTILQSGLAVVHAGEEVRPAQVTPTYGRGGGDGLTVNVYVAGSIVTQDDLTEATYAGLKRKENREGPLFKAA